jgi:hypothetical protein
MNPERTPISQIGRGHPLPRVNSLHVIKPYIRMRSAISVATPQLAFARPMIRALLFLVVSLPAVLAAQPRPLSSDEAKLLQQPIDLGQRLLAALSRYPEPSASANRTTGVDLITNVPTVEVLHSAGYVTDSDMVLARRYGATFQSKPAGSNASQPLLSMHTDRGELTFAGDGTLTLRRHE